MAECKHRRSSVVVADDAVATLVCRCGLVLPIGPARHTSAVLVELRAAELATSPVDAFGDGEWRGWQDWPYSDSHEDTPIAEWSAGWLANEIASHGKERS